MQLLKMILIGLTALVSLICMVIPFWFTYTVIVSLDAGRTTEQKTMNLGLYYMDQSKGIEMLSLISVDKSSNAYTYPPLFRVAQIFYGLGTSGSFVLFVASLVYLCRKYKSATGEMCLAGGMFPTSMCLVLGVVLAGIHTVVPADAFYSLPIPNHYMAVKADPKIAINIGFWIAVFSAGLSIAALVISWMQACSMCTHVENTRYQMLHAPLTEDERGVGSGKLYQFQPAQGGGGFRYDGYSKPGVEVDF